jgi:hypothetical protein
MTYSTEMFPDIEVSRNRLSEYVPFATSFRKTMASIFMDTQLSSASESTSNALQDSWHVPYFTS